MRLIYFTFYLLGAVILSYLFFVLVPGAVPAHRYSQTLFFELLVILFGFIIFFLALKSYKRLFLFCMLLMPVVPYFGTYLYPIGGPSLTILPELCIWILIAAGIKRVSRFPKDFINRFILLWIILSGLTMLTTVNMGNSMLVLLVGVIGPSIYCLVLHNHILADEKAFYGVLRFFILSTFIYVVFSLTMVIAGVGSSSLDQIYVGRFGMSLGLGRYSSGAVITSTTFVYPLLFYLMVSRHDLGREVNLIVKVLFWLISLIIPLVLSRGGFLLLLFYCLYFAFILLSRKMPGRRGRSLTGRVLVCIMGLAVISTFLFLRPQYREAFLERTVSSSYKGFTYMNVKEKFESDPRVMLWKDAVAIFGHNWFLGVGYGNLRDEMKSYSGYNLDAHNIFLNILAEGGIGIGLLFLCLFFIPGIRLYKRRKTMEKTGKDICVALFTGQMAYLLIGLSTGGNLLPSGEYYTGVYGFLLFTSISLQFYLMDVGGWVRGFPEKRSAVTRCVDNRSLWSRKQMAPPFEMHGTEMCREFNNP